MTLIEELSFPVLKERILSLETDLLLFISEENVWSKYQDRIFPILEQWEVQGRKYLSWTGPGGERIKSMENFFQCLDHFLSGKIHRKAHLLALGGGALSDFAGFVAASLLRGLSWSVIPTTLLGMVDASIGGKVGINSVWGKNLIGTFHLPRHVWILTQFLETLPAKEILSGKGEILKYAFLDKDIFRRLKSGQSYQEVIRICGQYKDGIVQKDLREENERAYLNLGHTFGHAFEKVLAISHGESVILGMEFIFRHFISNPFFLEEFYRIKEMLGIKQGLDLVWGNLDRTAFLQYVFRDKKIQELKKIRLVLLKNIGEPYIEEFSQEEIEKRIWII